MRRILNPALRFEINLTANISSTDNAPLHWPAIAVKDAFRPANNMVHAVVPLAMYNLGVVQYDSRACWYSRFLLASKDV